MLEFKKFWWMIKKEVLSLKRHPARLVSIIAFPIIMILLFGYGMGGEMTDLPILVVSQSHGNLTDLTLDTIKTTETYKVIEVIDDLDEGKKRVDSGEVKAAIILPSDYDDNSTQQKSVTLYLDSSDQMASQILDSSTQAIFSRLSNMVASQTNVENKDANINPSISNSFNNFKDDISLHINRIYGNIKYIDFLVPAILGMTVMMSCMMGMGATIAGERETGELARLFMTPTSVSTVIGGKIAAKLLIELLRALILIFMAVLLFNVSIKGGILQTFIVLVVGALCFVGFGMMLSARTSTQEDYVQMVMPFSMPMMFISGVFYPIETMPWILQKLAYIFPLTYLNDAMRGIMLKGQTLGDVWLDLAVLLGFTLLFFIIGVKRFNRDV
ncbi:MAG: ABC transporter permease [archaeon]|uniref:ABC-2 type transport system permease protein n=1 Tax=Methanobrevibacter gottschalkii DSM 11977 TaxID=1122229 RepID=A0A3N5B6X3_9EURY|nr:MULTISPECIES: ABC transporter permease [Methanobrevibacter]MCQ2971236.1 ABC transporter permease [archaeon]OEC93730.1 ABC transporter permease [Methanobrevibacter sp. A27]RPF52839.1 ABC-2 type transport system permease protein [Methanobrevibacter gottschalkii DSM 11977]